MAETVGQLSDSCEGDDADAHLEGRCYRHERAGGPPQDEKNCNEILTRLRAHLTMLSEDFAVAGPPLEASAMEQKQFELRRGCFLPRETCNILWKRSSGSASRWRVFGAIVPFHG